MIPIATTNQWIRVALVSIFVLLSFYTAWTGEVFYLVLPVCGLAGYFFWQKPRAAFYCLLATLPFSFEHTFASGWSMDLPDELLMLIVAFLAMIALLANREKCNTLMRHPIVQLLGLWFLWMIASSIFSSRQTISAKFVIAKSWYIGAFLIAPFVLLSSKERLVTAGKVLITAMLLVVLIVIARHALTGFRFSTINEAVSPFFRNHVNYSAMLVCLLPLLTVCYRLSSPKSKRLFAWLFVMIILPAVFFSYARGAWLALGTGVIAWWLIRKKLLLTAYILAVLIAGSLFSWLATGDRYVRFAPQYNTTIFHTDFRDHLKATYELKDISAAERYYRWIAAVRMVNEQPFTGSGPGTFYNNYKSYTVPAFRTWVSGNPEKSTAHNYFLLTAAEQGIPGFVLLLVLLGVCLWYAQRLYSSDNSVFNKLLALASGSMLVMIITLNLLSDLVETDKVGSLFFLSIAMLVITKRTVYSSNCVEA